MNLNINPHTPFELMCNRYLLFKLILRHETRMLHSLLRKKNDTDLL